jgi:hypothetical protein
MLPDSFHETMPDAMRELERRRKVAGERDCISRIEPSPYGGYRVRSIPVDFLVDMATDWGMMPDNRNKKFATSY